MFENPTLLIIGSLIIGDKKAPRNKVEVNMLNALPLTLSGVSFTVQMFTLGNIIPTPNPDKTNPTIKTQ